MKKILLLLFALMPLAAKCPPDYCLPIKRAEGIKPYWRVYQAVRQVESSCNPFAYNPTEGAVGELQIRKCRVDHYNNLTGKNYTLVDCYDPEISKEIFMYFAEKLKDSERICREWNGGALGRYKPSTEIYWRKIQKLL
jgi:hypothetical protein